MMRFYSMSLPEYRALSLAESEGLWQAITVIEAREQLLRFQASDWSVVMKKADRQKLHRSLHKDAFPPSLNNPDGLVGTTADFAKILAKGMTKGGR